MEQINVTKPFLAPVEEYKELIDEIWNSNILTNNGPKVLMLEKELETYLGAKNLLFIGNGTISMQIAIKALGIKGEVITTPFSYIATTSCIIWENCSPIFVDIDNETYNINHALIEENITDATSAILVTHVFGNPCEIEQIAKIAKKYELKIIYDAAHCFNVKYNDECVLNFGDVSSTSLHATKTFHTVEGGTLTARSEEVLAKMSKMRNFGHNGFGKFSEVGINGKNSEFHAAMGLVNLRYIDVILKRRKEQYLFYKTLLKNENLRFQKIHSKASYNYSYFPILFENEDVLLQVIVSLNKQNIFPRRYFYPGLNDIEIVEKVSMPVSDDIASRILCLPLYYELTNKQIERISTLIIDKL